MAFRCVRCHTEIDRSFKACPHCGEPVTDFFRRYADQPVDGKYRLLERLGAGGMGEVYKVEHVFLRSTRVIKVIRPQIAESDDAHDRFLREAQMATKVQHPDVATLHDFAALPDGSHYMVWEFIDGENLAQVIRHQGVLVPQHAIRLAVQALAGLEAIHRAGIVHRDMSPENLMITHDEHGNERVKIIDLGVAKAEGDYATTRSGIFVGKLRYSSPEHLGFLAEGEKIDGRADLYSLAIVLFEMLTGRPPFEATSPHQYILHHSRETTAQPLDLTRVPDELRPLLTKGLERDRSHRFASAREFAEALQRVASILPDEEETQRVTPPATTVRTDFPQQPPAATVIERRRQTGLLVAIALVVVALGALATWHYRSQPVATVVTNTVVAQPIPAPPPPTTTVEVMHPPPVQSAPPKRVPAAVASQREPEPSAPSIHTYVDGGDSSTNEAALSFAQEHLRGVSRVSLDTTGDADLGRQLADAIRRNNLTITDSSDVVIHFHGTLAHLRFGRKRRSAEASISKGGRTVFRYQLRSEEYRVGDNPAEAFARVLSDVFGR